MMMESKRVYLVVFIIRALYAGMQVISKIAFTKGMNTFVFVFYRQAFATLFLTPLALFLERGRAPALSLVLCLKIFAIALFSMTGCLVLFNVALDYTSATLAAVSVNTVPVITFVLAVILGVEAVNLKRLSGIAKVSGVGLCVGGVAIMAFYKGPYIKPLSLHFPLLEESGDRLGEKWILGTFLMIMSNAMWSSWIIFQGPLLKEVPSTLLLNTMECFCSTLQSFVIAIAFERDFNEWKLGFNVRLLSVAYCGIVVTGISFYLESWCIKKKGPVFLAMSMPLTLIITILISLFVLGEGINLQSIIGGGLMIGGLYCVLVGKSKEQQQNSKEQMTDIDEVLLPRSKSDPDESLEIIT